VDDPDVTRASAEAPTIVGTFGGPVNGPLRIGQEIGSRYQIQRLLGVGGMGAVYEAWDEELGVPVALKVIRQELVANPDTARDLERRFKLELLIGRRVTHENVVRIHDLGHVDNLLYITMPYIDGEDLASIVEREGVLPVPRVMKIARTMAAGLAAAHAAGVIHRDLKPANIMVTAEGAAMIMDFGVALSVGGSSVSSSGTNPLGMFGDAQTVAGAVIGTLEYMAPEQARGIAVDQRADIYAFGLILYDILVGRRRRDHGASALVELERRMQSAPAAPKSLAPDVSEALDRLISRCLEPDPDRRFQTTGELVSALNRLDGNGVLIPTRRVFGVPVVAAVIALAIGVPAPIWYFSRAAGPPIQRAPVSVLIADVSNASGDAAFDGTVEQSLGIAVEQASFITVYPRKEARALASKLSPAGGGRIDTAASQLIARSEGLKVVLAGSVARKGSGYVVAVNVIDPGDGRVLRTISAESPSRERVLKAVDTVAAGVRAFLGETKAEAANLASAETFTTASLGAMQAYSRAQELSAQGRREEALKAYAEAVAADPEFGRAYAGMGTTYYNLKQIDKADEAFQKALKRLDRMTDRERYRTLGGYYITVVRNYEQARDAFAELVKKYPSDNVGYGNLALSHFFLHEFARAKEMGVKSVELSPRDNRQRSNLASFAMYDGDFTMAIAEAETLLQQNPNYDRALLTLALSRLAEGNSRGALEAYERLAGTTSFGAAAAVIGRADVALSEGRGRDALEIVAPRLEAARQAGDTATLGAFYVASAEASLAAGRKGEAARYAEAAAGISKHEAVLFPAALVLIQTGREDAAQEIAAKLEAQLQAQTISYARLIDGQAALVHGRFGHAIEALRAAQQRYDSWFSHLLLGRAFMDAGPAHAAEAVLEFEKCLKRKGEATDAFLNDTPSVRYLPQVYYWLARAQELVGSTAAAKSNYELFLARRAAPEASDELAADARRRLK
jgi:tetratricopeptide (TPR) repeat protein